MSATRTVNRRTAAAAIADRVQFRNSGGTFHGRPIAFTCETGRLPLEQADALRAALRSGAADYVVFSYGTPIAWTGSGGDVIPDVRYSTTTSGHQGIVRVALSLLPSDPYIVHSRGYALEIAGCADGEVIDRDAWADAGYPCQHCGIRGGH